MLDRDLGYNELKLQKIWKKIWEKEEGVDVLMYGRKSGFVSYPNSRSFRPDFIILHKTNLRYFFRGRSINLGNIPIAVEFKKGIKFKDIVYGIQRQMSGKYLDFRFISPKYGINQPQRCISCFTTHTLLTRGFIYYKPEKFSNKEMYAINFATIRFSWIFEGDVPFRSGILLYSKYGSLSLYSIEHLFILNNHMRKVVTTYGRDIEITTNRQPYFIEKYGVDNFLRRMLEVES